MLALSPAAGHSAAACTLARNPTTRVHAADVSRRATTSSSAIVARRLYTRPSLAERPSRVSTPVLDRRHPVDTPRHPILATSRRCARPVRTSPLGLALAVRTRPSRTSGAPRTASRAAKSAVHFFPAGSTRAISRVIVLANASPAPKSAGNQNESADTRALLNVTHQLDVPKSTLVNTSLPRRVPVATSNRARPVARRSIRRLARRLS